MQEGPKSENVIFFFYMYTFLKVYIFYCTNSGCLPPLDSRGQHMMWANLKSDFLFFSCKKGQCKHWPSNVLALRIKRANVDIGLLSFQDLKIRMAKVNIGQV